MDDGPPPASTRQRWAVVLIVVWAVAFTFVGGLMLVAIGLGGTLVLPSILAFALLLMVPLLYLRQRRPPPAD